MKELLRTNDAVLLSWLTALLRSERIEPVLFDAHTSVIEGSISAIPRRLMVADEDHARARRIIEEAGEGIHLA
jgi:Putative prokaryotic signal transducing protein